MKLLWVVCLVIWQVLNRRAAGFEVWNATELPAQVRGRDITDALVVGLELISSAAAKGAVCLDGTLPGYHLNYGHGSGANSWLIQLEGGGWCSDIRMCIFRKATHHGSSNYMEKLIPFRGILSNRPEENPDFYNWNRVKVRYCDGASFSGEGYDEAHGLFFGGQHIWLAAMEELMLKGMRYAQQALLSGCSAGGLSAILHCDEFRALFPVNSWYATHGLCFWINLHGNTRGWQRICLRVAPPPWIVFLPTEPDQSYSDSDFPFKFSI